MPAMAGYFDHLTELEIVALTIWGETRGEPLLAKIAVGCIIRNRVTTRHLSYRDVCLQPKQFSCFIKAGGADNFQRVVQQAGSLAESPVWNECKWIASGIIYGYCPDVTGGADHYMTTDLYNSPSRPSWAGKMTYCGEQGAHTLLRA